MKSNSTPQWVSYAPISTSTEPIPQTKLEKLNIYEIALDVYGDFVLEARNKKILLLLETDHEWSEGQTIDPNFEITNTRYDVHNILGQMVKNALAQTLEGSIKIHISRLENQFIIDVDDTGIGVHPDEKICLVETKYRGKMCKITYVQDPNTSFNNIGDSLKIANAKMLISVEQGEGMKRRLLLPKVAGIQKEVSHTELAII